MVWRQPSRLLAAAYRTRRAQTAGRCCDGSPAAWQHSQRSTHPTCVHHC